MKLKGKKYDISIKEYVVENMEEIFVACHGFGGDKESSAIEKLAQEVNSIGIGVICFDFPAHGESSVDGSLLTIDNCIDDLKSVEEYALNKYKIKKINIFATSFGAYIALLKICKMTNNYNAIILRAPAIKMDEIFKNYLLKDSLSNFYKKGYTIMGFERQMKIPVRFLTELEAKENKVMNVYKDTNEILIIQGDQDNVAPIKDTYEFIEKNKNVKLKVLEGADHRMKKAGELDKVFKWVKEYLS